MNLYLQRSSTSFISDVSLLSQLFPVLVTPHYADYLCDCKRHLYFLGICKTFTCLSLCIPFTTWYSFTLPMNLLHCTLSHYRTNIILFCARVFSSLQLNAPAFHSIHDGFPNLFEMMQVIYLTAAHQTSLFCHNLARTEKIQQAEHLDFQLMLAFLRCSWPINKLIYLRVDHSYILFYLTDCRSSYMI